MKDGISDVLDIAPINPPTVNIKNPINDENDYE